MAASVTDGGGRSEVEAAVAALEAEFSGWPVVEAWFSTEAEAMQAAGLWAPVAVRSGIAATQVELLEPADDAPGARWGLRYTAPGLDAAALVALAEQFRKASPEVSIGVARSPGLQAAVDEGLLEEFEFGSGLSRGFTWATHADGRPRRVDVFRGSRGVDASWLALEHRVARAFADQGLGFESDCGADTLQPVVDAASGALGFELTCGSEGAEAGTAQRIVAALDAVVAPPDDPSALRVARTFCLQPGLAWQVMGALLVPPGWVPRLSIPSTVHFEPRARREPHVTEFELLLAPPFDVEESTWYTALAQERGVQVCSPASPRWVSVAGRQRCLARWKVHPADVHALDAEALLDAAPEVALLVPGAPSGLEERWSVCEPEWYFGRSRCVMRIRDAAQNVDLLPLFQQGTPDDWSTVVFGAIDEVLLQLNESDRRVILAPGGRRGVAVAVPVAALQAAGFDAVLAAVADPDMEAVSPVVYAGWHRGKFLFTIWETEDLHADVQAEPRAWGGASSSG